MAAVTPTHASEFSDEIIIFGPSLVGAASGPSEERQPPIGGHQMIYLSRTPREKIRLPSIIVVIAALHH
jgi:hypothetical protein